MKVDNIQIQNSQARLEELQSPQVRGSRPKDDGKLWKACQDFESMFMGYIIKSMEKTLPQGSLSGSGISDMMFDQVMGSALSEGGGIGLAELLYRDLQIKHTQNSAESDNGISLQDLLLDPVRKENNDD
ncbi:rod-binding protein [Candidatus Neomarinimicrobiota bacterium]